MSGTSLDGVDAVAVRLDATGAMEVLGHVHEPLPPQLCAELLALNAPGPDELHRAALAANALSRVYARATVRLLSAAALAPDRVRAVGAHGQTLRHRPGEFDGTGYTLQLLNGALLAELTGIDVVCDLRSRDLAAGGQGAPLVPAFHAARFARRGQTVAVLNIGGMANISVLRGDTSVVGFDCGPGNVLLDHWCMRQRGQPFDADGAWAASGHVQPPLLGALLDEPFFRRPPPKSTGRDLFNATWLDARLSCCAPAQPKDVQATLAELTATTAAEAVHLHAPQAQHLLVCGGGALNRDLMHRLSTHLPDVTVVATDQVGLPAMQVEACAFAWLAHCHVERRAGNLAEVTGARGPRILGALHPAR
jgi:anhydro-N-acetylmuramic acid kinase